MCRQPLYNGHFQHTVQKDFFLYTSEKGQPPTKDRIFTTRKIFMQLLICVQQFITSLQEMTEEDLVSKFASFIPLCNEER